LRSKLGAAAVASGTRAGGLVVILALGLSVACQTPSPSPSGSLVATSVAPGPPTASSSNFSPPVASSSAGAIAVDPSLLAILPAEVAGAPVQPDPVTAAQIAADPSLVADVEAVAVAIAVSAGSSGNEDLVIANVVRFRPDVFTDEFFRGWRDTYNAGACERAGGVGGNAEAEIAGRQVFIGSCTDGAFTYHLRYGEDVIVSLTSVGEGRLGEQLVKNLGN
jgi:hypothetical protein